MASLFDYSITKTDGGYLLVMGGISAVFDSYSQAAAFVESFREEKS